MKPSSDAEAPPDESSSPATTAGATEAHATVGWREWVRLPRLGVGRLKAKIDTGARTSALHATHIEALDRDGHPWVQFRVYDDHRNPAHFVVVTARLCDVRSVRNSGGIQDERPVIQTEILLGRLAFRAELTLVERTDMVFPMLLGRTALRTAGVQVDPARSFLMRRRSRPC